MKIITISGTQSNTGKTTLARKLKVALPDSLILKIGLGKEKNKPELLVNDINKALELINTFKKEKQYNYLIIESNKILNFLKPDLSFYIKGTIDKIKQSALDIKDKADITFSNCLDISVVKEILIEKKAFSNAIIDSISTVTEEFYSDYILQKLVVKTKVWLDLDDKMVFGPGKYELLKSIQKTSSLNKAAKELKMSYRHAWAYIKTMEKRLGQKILVLKEENKKHSGSELSAFANKLVAKYEDIL